MVSNKKRLYVALYPSGVSNDDERRYHWAFLVGPKVEKNPPVPGTRYHVKNTPRQQWIYEETSLANIQMTTNLLARILIAKVEDEGRLVNIFRTTKVVQGDPNWRCRTWISDVLLRIQEDGKAVGTAILDWSVIEAQGREYVAAKTRAGRYGGEVDMRQPRPTWDLIEGKETVE